MADEIDWKRRYEDEYAIVERCWKALGISTFEGTQGKSIHELIADLRARLATLEQEKEAAVLFLNRDYVTQEGKTVRLISVHQAGTEYETMQDEAGVHRYSRRLHDLGRVTGSAHDFSCPQNIRARSTDKPSGETGRERG